MTWAEFKARVEADGITDADEIAYVHWVDASDVGTYRFPPLDYRYGTVAIDGLPSDWTEPSDEHDAVDCTEHDMGRI